MAPSVKSTASFETGMLSFARSIQITEGLFFATKADKPDVRTPIEILEKGVRGQSSEDKAKNPGLSNPQSVEYAVVPQGHDGVSLEFSIRFMPLSLKPHACNDLMVGSSYARLASAYSAAGGYRVLAALYLWNLANARFAWRNRFQSDTMRVGITLPSGEKVTLNPFMLDLDKVNNTADMHAAVITGRPEAIELLISGIADGLSKPSGGAYTLQVAWEAVMEPGQEVFPSQEYIREEKADKFLSRVLAKLPVHKGDRTIMQASMHSQKIGAAMRHIDIWHNSDEHEGPIAVNPYGGVQETSAVLRAPKTKRSFYDLRKKADAVLAALESAQTAEEISGDTHFLMANLVRGGVFGLSKKGEAPQ